MQRSLFFISVWFQALWFMAVLGREFLMLPLLVLVALTYLWTWKTSRLSSTLTYVFLLGMAVDFLNYRVGLYQFNGINPLGMPIWLILLWCMFAWYAVMMKPVINRFHPAVIIVFGAVGGTLSYLAGARFGAVTLPFGTVISAIALALEWLALSYIIVRMSKTSITIRSKAKSTAYKSNHLI